MKLGKLILGAGVVTSALAVSAGLNTQSASAEDAKTITQTNIKVDFANQEITVAKETSSNVNNKLYVAVGSYRASAPTNITAKKWIEYDAKDEASVAIDTSSLATTKDQYIAIKGDVTVDPVVVKLPASPKKLSASIDYNSTTKPVIKLKDVTKGKASAVAVTKIQYSKVNGSWTDYTSTADSETDLTGCQKFGATLKVREKAFTTPTAPNDNSATATLNTKTTPLYTFKDNTTKGSEAHYTFASKEVRVKIPKLAAGPRVSVNYLKNTVSLPKTAEYRTAVGTFTPVNGTTATVTKTLKEINSSDSVTADFTLDVRTAAKTTGSDSTKFKSASNITEIAVSKDAYTALTIKAGDADVDDDKKLQDTAVMNGDSKVVTFAYASGETLTTGTFTNQSSDAYDVYIANKPDTIASNITGYKTLKAGLGKTLKINVNEGDIIYIRKAGNKAKKTFASTFTKFGKAKVADVKTATSDQK